MQYYNPHYTQTIHPLEFPSTPKQYPSGWPPGYYPLPPAPYIPPKEYPSGWPPGWTK
jgi:hypothetical protein